MLGKISFRILLGLILATSIFASDAFINIPQARNSAESLFLIQESDFDLGFKAYEKGDYETAIYHYTRHIGKNPKSDGAYNNRGLAYSNLQKYDLAVADFDKALEINSENFLSYSGKGFVYYKKGNYALAIREFATAIQLNPNDNFAYNTRGWCYKELGKTDLAEADFAKAADILAKKKTTDTPPPPPKKDPPAGPQSDTNDEDFQMGAKLIGEEKYDQAISYFTRYLNRYPNDKVGYVNRGLSNAFSGRYDAALADYDKAISLDSQYSTPYAGRGFVNLMLKKADVALRDLNTAIKLDPKNKTAYIIRAAVYKAMGETALADADTAKANELDGKKPANPSGGGSGGGTPSGGGTKPSGGTTLADITPEEALKYGINAYDNEKYEVAVVLFTKYLGAFPNNKEVYYFRGLANRRLNNLDWAVADYNKSNEIDKNYVAPYIARGFVFALQKKFDLAIRDYTTAIKINPNEKQAYFNRAIAYKAIGKTKNASEDDAKGLLLETAESEAKLSKLVPLSPNSKGVSWTPVIEMDRQIFPSYFLARSSIPVNEIKGESVIGDNNGILGLHIVNPKKDSKIKIGVQLDPLIGYQEYEATLSVKDRRYRIFPKIIWDWEALKRAKKPTPANASFTLYINGELVEKRTVVVKIRSINEAILSYRFLDNENWANTSELFAAYVNEEHEFIDQLLKEALDLRLVKNFSGYQGGPEGVQNQLFAIWFILQRRGFKYSSITDTSSTANMVNSQYVRLFDESIKVSQANCVDGSVLIAAILKRIGISVGLVIVPGHCFLVVDMDGKGDFRGFETTVVGEIDFRDYDAKTVVDASYKTYKYALTAGDKRFRESLPSINAKHPLYHVIFIEKARQNGISTIN